MYPGETIELRQGRPRLERSRVAEQATHL